MRSRQVEVPQTQQEVQEARSLITSLVNALTRKDVVRWRRNIDRWTSRSTLHTEALFVAARTLRNDGVLSAGDAAYLFRESFTKSANLPALDEVFSDTRYSEDTFCPDSVSRELAREVADYHRARGEERIADLVVRSPNTWFDLCDAGRFSLTVMRPEVPGHVPIEPDPVRVAFFRDRMTAFAASEESRSPEIWFTPGKRVTIDDVASGIGAARALRESGIVRSWVATFFIDTFIEGGLSDLFDDEPVWVRLCKLQSAPKPKDAAGRYEAAEPPYRRVDECLGWSRKAWVLLSDAYSRMQNRAPALKAKWLERFGEPELAAMLLEQPTLYHRWVSAPKPHAIVPPRASRRR